MNLSIAIELTASVPISDDWTIADLLDWLADSDRCHDRALDDRLRTIERALAMAAGEESWRARPGTVALVRSIAATARADHRVRGLRIGELLARHEGRAAAPTRERAHARYPLGTAPPGQSPASRSLVSSASSAGR